jgi:hypothetical protein
MRRISEPRLHANPLIPKGVRKSSAGHVDSACLSEATDFTVTGKNAWKIN